MDYKLIEQNKIEHIKVKDIKVKDIKVDKKIEHENYIHYSNLPKVLVKIYSTTHNKYGNLGTETFEYTVYIDEPYFIYIVINKDGIYDFYKSTKQIDETKEGFFNVKLNKNICNSFYCNIINLYKLLNNNLMGANRISGFVIMDLIAFYSSFKTINKYFKKNNIDLVIDKMNELLLKIPTFEELYGFSNIVLDDKFIIDKLNEIEKLNEINNFHIEY